MRAAAIVPRRATPTAPRWVDRSPDRRVPLPRLVDACHGNMLLAAILRARGLTAEDAAMLLGDTAYPLGDPFLLPDMGRTVAHLRAAARAHERCVVFGDFDGDGLTGTALLAEGLSALGLRV